LAVEVERLAEAVVAVVLHAEAVEAEVGVHHCLRASRGWVVVVVVHLKVSLLLPRVAQPWQRVKVLLFPFSVWTQFTV
jgi:hypothetical protein